MYEISIVSWFLYDDFYINNIVGDVILNLLVKKIGKIKFDSIISLISKRIELD